jgi:glycosyltransferase involved in cell wall biosynthesis
VTDNVAARPLAGLRVTTVLNWAALGGAERRALRVARWLRDDEGAEVEFLALTDRDGRASEAARSLRFPWRVAVVNWDGGKGAKASESARFVRALRRGKPDLVLSYCSLPNVLSALGWKAAGATTSVWYQGDVSPFRRARDSTRRRAARNAPVLVANAEHAVEHLVDEWGAPRARTRVIRTGVLWPEPGTTRAEWRTQVGLADDDFVACMVAHFRRSKDHATLLRAWRIVVDELERDGRRAVLLLAGDAYPMQDAAKALAFDLRLDQTVRFLDEVDDVQGLVAASDVSVLSSFREGLATSVLEAMAAGVPVAGTDIPGIREAVGTDGAPFLTPLGDANALGSVLLGLARDVDLRARLGVALAERVRTEFTVEKMLAAYRETLVGALAVPARTRWRRRGPS